jgi:hypothetical protein
MENTAVKFSPNIERKNVRVSISRYGFHSNPSL